MCIQPTIKSLYSLMIASVVSIFCSGHALANEPVFVGILESFNKQEWSDETQQNSINPRVRVPFFKEGDHWQAMKNDFDTPEQLSKSTIYYPGEVKWLVINNGYYLGDLSTVQYTPHWYADIGIQKIIGNLPEKFLLPPIKNLNFPMIGMDHKPIVMISKFNNALDNFTDAEGWTISKPTNEEMKQVLKGLHPRVVIIPSYPH